MKGKYKKLNLSLFLRLYVHYQLFIKIKEIYNEEGNKKRNCMGHTTNLIIHIFKLDRYYPMPQEKGLSHQKGKGLYQDFRCAINHSLDLYL